MAFRKTGLRKDGNWQCSLCNIQSALNFCFIPVLQYITLLQTNPIYQGKSFVSDEVPPLR